MELKINQKIKLIIWDMDETFWKGTLSEEKIEFLDENIKFLKTLTDRGIMNSISSKNEFENVKKKLAEKNLWEYFLFPKISWDPKGQQIKNTISQMQLRPCNILFIDDNISNLKEAIFYNPELQILEPKYISELIDHPMLQGKPDANHTRLKQYKILESKEQQRKELNITNEEFLKSSNIEIAIDDFDHPYLERVSEMVERYNQLNFTKLRSNKSELKTLINNKKYISKVINVKDKFGDYGLCGFYVVQDQKLIHFLFSCRIMNMGIESWTYHHLKKPSIDIVGEVSSKISNTKPNWIFHQKKSRYNDKKNKLDSKGKKEILIFGGCDLQQIEELLKNDFNVDTEFNYALDNQEIRKDHTELILGKYPIKFNFNKNIPFIKKESFSSKIFNKNYDAIIFSPLMDFHQGLYKHKFSEFIMPKESFELDLTDRGTFNDLRKKVFNKEFCEWFAENFEKIGPITVEKFKSNIRKIEKKIGKNTKLILITGAEIDKKFSNQYEKNHLQRHVEMNKALEELEEEKIIYLIDVRKKIKNKNDITDSLRHFSRRGYLQIADLSKAMLRQELNLLKKEEKNNYSIFNYKYNVKKLFKGFVKF
jgi:FkbH-like protein